MGMSNCGAETLLAVFQVPLEFSKCIISVERVGEGVGLMLQTLTSSVFGGLFFLFYFFAVCHGCDLECLFCSDLVLLNLKARIIKPPFM